MRITLDQARILLAVQGLAIPERDIEEVALRLSTWLTALEEIEAELGEAMNAVDPAPPVFPREEF
jgi:hypothetical protein